MVEKDLEESDDDDGDECLDEAFECWGGHHVGWLVGCLLVVVLRASLSMWWKWWK